MQSENSHLSQLCVADGQKRLHTRYQRLNKRLSSINIHPCQRLSIQQGTSSCSSSMTLRLSIKLQPSTLMGDCPNASQGVHGSLSCVVCHHAVRCCQHITALHLHVCRPPVSSPSFGISPLANVADLAEVICALLVMHACMSQPGYVACGPSALPMRTGHACLQQFR